MILRGRQDDVVAAGHDDEDRGFVAGQTIFDENLAAGCAEFISREYVVHGRLGFRERLRDDDAFAGGEAVGFDDDGRAALAQIIKGGRHVGEDARGGSGYFIFQQELLRENFRRLKPRAVGLGAVGGNAGRQQLIHEAERERDLGADDNEFDFLALGERDEPGDVIDRDGKARDVLRDARVARRADHARQHGGERERLDERVFAPAGADDKDGGGEFISHG